MILIMLHTLKSLWHKAVGLYIIAGFVTISLPKTAFAQFGVNADKTSGLESLGGGQDKWDGIIGIIKNFINYALSFLALIALGMLLWGGYKMVASGGNEEAYQEGIKILKNAAIGIAFIAVSWFLVTFIFSAIGFVVGG